MLTDIGELDKASASRKGLIMSDVERKILFQNEWLSLRELITPNWSYTYSHEVRCHGHMVAILPYRKAGNSYEYALRKEITPPWGLEHSISAITGGWDGEGTFRDTALRELREEAGYQINKQGLVRLGVSRASKSSDTLYHLYAVDVTGLEPETPPGDGTPLEDKASIIWTQDPCSEDPQVGVILWRLHKILAHLEATNETSINLR